MNLPPLPESLSAQFLFHQMHSNGLNIISYVSMFGFWHWHQTTCCGRAEHLCCLMLTPKMGGCVPKCPHILFHRHLWINKSWIHFQYSSADFVLTLWTSRDRNFTSPVPYIWNFFLSGDILVGIVRFVISVFNSIVIILFMRILISFSWLLGRLHIPLFSRVISFLTKSNTFVFVLRSKDCRIQGKPPLFCIGVRLFSSPYFYYSTSDIQNLIYLQPTAHSGQNKSQ